MARKASSPEVAGSDLPPSGNIGHTIDALRTMEPGDLALLQMLALQETTRRADPLKSLEYTIPHSNPISLLFLGDTHLGSVSTDYGLIDTIRRQVVSSPTTYVVLLGDLIEGWTQKFMSTNQVRALPPEKQITLFQSFMRPLYDTGRIICSVSEYFGHEGWIVDASGLNVWERMLGDMKIPIVQNGAMLTLRFKNGHEQRYVLSHNAGRRNSTDPVHGARSRAIASGAGVSAAAHLHIPGIAEEYTSANASSRIVSVQGGAAKGVEPDLPADNHATRAALGGGGPLGQAVVVSPRTRDRHQVIHPTTDIFTAQMLVRSMELLNSTEKQGVTGEVLGEIIAAFPTPTIKLLARRSERTGDETVFEKQQRLKTTERQRARIEKKKKKEVVPDPVGDNQSAWFPDYPYVKPYSLLTYSLQSELPFVLQPIANLRLGSGSAKKQEFARFVDEIAADPYVFTVWLGNVMDKYAGQLSNRKQLLDELVGYMKQLDKRNLGVMLSDTLRRSSWKHALGDSPEMQPIPPASYLSDQSGVPLVENQSRIRLQLGADKSTDLLVAPFDKLLNRASLTAPTKGPMSVYSIINEKKPGILMTGYALGAGWAQIFDSSNGYPWPVMMASGWWSTEADMASKGNIVAGAKPGAAVIVVPSEQGYTLVPVGSTQDRGTFGDALRLLVGANKLGIADKITGIR